MDRTDERASRRLHGAGRWRRPLVTTVWSMVVLMALQASQTVAASDRSCRVENTGSGQTYWHLQQAVNAAKPGARLIVRGTCKGGTFIDRDISIVGRGMTRTSVSNPTVLSGKFRARVLTIKPGVRVSIGRLYIMNGRASRIPDGGGIMNKGTLTLRQVYVNLNRAVRGGGIFNAGVLRMFGSGVALNQSRAAGQGIYNTGRLVLDASVIGGNTDRTHDVAVVNEGTIRMKGANGIADSVLNRGTMVMGGTARIGGLLEESSFAVSNAGTLVMNDASRIYQHRTYYAPGRANGPGASVYNTGSLTLNDTASIHHNRAGHPAPGQAGRGGAVYNAGTVTMTGSSSIHSNVAYPDENGVPGLGGGLYNASGGTLVGVICGVNVYRNTPDDCYFE